MVKEYENNGLPAVHMASIVPISKTVGANRIIPTVAIPHPLGDPNLDDDDEYKLRKQLLEKALKALETEIELQTVFED